MANSRIWNVRVLLFLSFYSQLQCTWSDEGAPTGSTEPDLCPYKERRLPRELYTKLFIVHFTVIASYAHLAHLRNEPRGLLSYLCVLVCPLAGATVIAVQLLSLAVQCIICRDHHQAIVQSIAIVIGRLPRNIAEASSREAIQWPPRLSRILTGRFGRQLVPVLVVLAQCVTSIALFVRRAQHGSVMLYDQRILQLAVLGLSVAVMSVVHIVLEPQYSFHFIHPDRDESPEKLEWLWWVRPTVVSSASEQGTPSVRSSPSDDSEEITCSKCHYPIFDLLHIFVIMCAAFALSSELYPLAPISATSMLHGFDLILMLWTSPCLQAILVACSLGAFLGSLKERGSFAEAISLSFLVWIGLNNAYMLLVLTTTLLLPFLVDFLLKPFYGLWHFWLLFSGEDRNGYLNGTPDCGFGPDWRKIAASEVAPTFCPCPQAWKDEVADWVWWLA